MLTYDNLKTRTSYLKWAENIPDSWKVLPMRALLEERKEKNVDGNVDNILSVMKDVGVIRYADKGNVGNKSSERPESYKKVYRNDIVINSMNLVIGSVGLSNEEGVTSSVYIIFKLKDKNNDVRFFYDLFRDKSFQRHLGTFGRGMMELRESVKAQDIKNQLIPVPEPLTQKRIADFLDKKIKIIDQLIEKKKKLIELLKEKRVSIITKIVSKGLDPKVKMKASGVEWISEIPTYWKILKLKFIGKVQASNVDKNYSVGEKEVKLCNYIDVYKNEKINKNFMFMNATASTDQIKKFTIKSGDVLLTKDSETADDIGIPAYVQNITKDDKIVCGYHLYHIKSDLINTKFLFRYFQNKKVSAKFEISSNGVTRFGLSSYPLLNLEILIPTKVEQTVIADYIDKITEKVDKSLKKINEQVIKLSEYRSSVIYNVLTGKIIV